MATRLTVEKRVENGVKWLDKYGPDDWRNKVDIKELDLSSGCQCVLGQVFANQEIDDDFTPGEKIKIASGWDYVMDWIGSKIGFKRVVNNPVSFGFDADFKVVGRDTYGYPKYRDDYNDLTDEWKRVLGRK